MTLLGSGPAFNVGSSGPDPSLGKSLDEIIEERRKQQTKESKRGPKKASTADRSIASGKAKRDAAVKAKRGLTESKKPAPMDVEREVYRQSRKTEKEKQVKQKKATGGRVAPDSTGRSQKKKAKKAEPPAAIFGGRAPPKLAIEAAVKGMEAAGYKVPAGHQMVMTFVPTQVVPAAPKPDPKGKNPTSAKTTLPKGGNKSNTKGSNKNAKGNGKSGGGQRKN